MSKEESIIALWLREILGWQKWPEIPPPKEIITKELSINIDNEVGEPCTKQR